MPQELRKKLSQKFLKSFQSTLYIEDTKSFPKDGVKFLSNSLFELTLNHKQGSPDINILTPTITKDKIEFDNSIINIVNDDMPFLVDSITAAVNDLGYHISLIVNKVIYVKRDKTGDLQDISYSSSDESLKAESVIL